MKTDVPPSTLHDEDMDRASDTEGHDDMTGRSLNKVILMASLAEDPISEDPEKQDSIVGLSAFTRRYWPGSRYGDDFEETEWHRIVVVNQELAHYARQELRRGHHVYLEGELQTVSWRTELYDVHYLTRIILWTTAHCLKRLDDDSYTERANARGQLEAAKRCQLFGTYGER